MRWTLLICLLFPLVGLSQTTAHRAGELYAYWGWNRSVYSHSTIRFTGDEYDFKLYAVVARDRQSPFSAKLYLNPATFTIPQYNFRIGVYLNDKYDLSFGADHMKYVMVNDRDVLIDGHINNSGTAYDGTYDMDTINLSRDFLLFEHTDGLNYENIELRRSDVLYGNKWFRIESRLGAGAGVMIPKTNTTLLNNPRYDEFHVSGYGLGLIGGLHFSFFKHFFFQFEAKGGFVHMPDIRTTMNKADRASQHFFFAQFNGVFGANINLIRLNKKDKQPAPEL